LNVLSVEVLYAQLGLQNLDIDYEYIASIADPVCLSRISDPNFSIFDPGSQIQGQTYSGSRIRIRIKVFLTQKIVSKLSDL
jgi:hypothetical protein